MPSSPSLQAWRNTTSLSWRPIWADQRSSLPSSRFRISIGSRPKSWACECDQPEGQQNPAAVLPAVAQPADLRHAVPVAADRLSVDQARAHPGRAGGLGDERVAVRPVVPVAGEKADAGGAAQFA